jgi:hypothetical protein
MIQDFQQICCLGCQRYFSSECDPRSRQMLPVHADGKPNSCLWDVLRKHTTIDEVLDSSDTKNLVGLRSAYSTAWNSEMYSVFRTLYLNV